MFNPSRTQIRTFFQETWRKAREGALLTPLESMTIDWISEHPEYHLLLEGGPEAIEKEYTPEGGHTNPYLHLSMHLSISEQTSIDQPAGIRSATDALATRLGSLHEAHHQVMECLGAMLWNAQRDGAEPDAAAYLECIRRRVGKPLSAA